MSWFLCLLPSCPWAPLVCIQRCVKFQQVLWSCYLHAKLCLAGGHMIQSRPMSQSPIGDQWHLGSFAHFFQCLRSISVRCSKLRNWARSPTYMWLTWLHPQGQTYRYMWLHVIACDCMCLHIFHGCDCATSFMMEFARFCKTSCWCGSAGSLCQVFAILAVQLIATTVIAGLTLGELSHSCTVDLVIYQNPLIISHYIIYTCNIYI